jgi:hypothetical protein
MRYSVNRAVFSDVSQFVHKVQLVYILLICLYMYLKNEYLFQRDQV